MATDVLNTAMNLSANSLTDSDVLMSTAVAGRCVRCGNMICSNVLMIGNRLWSNCFNLISGLVDFGDWQLGKGQWLIGGHLGRRR